MHSLKTRPLASAGPLAAALLALLPVAATHAQVTNYATFKLAQYQQTGPAAPTSPANYFFGSQTTVTDPANDASTATVTLPDGTTTYSAALSGNTFFYNSPIYTDKTAFDAAYPNGTYTFNIDGGDGTYTPDSGQLTISGDLYPSAIPAFDPSTVAALPSYNPSSDFTFHFNSFTPDPNTTAAFSFFNIFDATTGVDAFGTELASTSVMSITVPGGTLSPNHAYQVVLDFSNRQDTQNAGFFLSGNGALATVGFDDRTTFDFTTAPEPTAFAASALGALGLAGLMLRARRRDAQG